MNVDIELVKRLRERTGLGVKECKEALVEVGGDVDRAVDFLRERGALKVEKVAGRAMSQGAIGCLAATDGKSAVLVELACESDFVAREAGFRGFLEAITQVALAKGSSSVAALKNERLADGRRVEEGLIELIAKTGENTEIRAVARLEGAYVGSYLHHNRMAAALVAVDRDEARAREAAQDLCMHCVFAQPRYLSAGEIPEAVRHKEEAILLEAAKNDPKMAQKPAELVQKAVQGQLQRRLGEMCLLGQAHHREDKLTVERWLQKEGGGARVIGFSWWKVGGRG